MYAFHQNKYGGGNCRTKDQKLENAEAASMAFLFAEDES
jgi:hypothetical protein